MKHRFFLHFFSLSALALTACGKAPEATSPAVAVPPLNASPVGVDASAPVMGTDGSEIGQAFVVGGPHGLLLRVSVSGLTEGFHGVHIHGIGNCSDPEAGFKASGSHFNPGNMAHGIMNPDGYKLANLPNIYVYPSGDGRAELFAKDLFLEEALDQDGFSIIVHQNQDDHQSQPIGGTGPRVACAAFQ
ncbi:MAG: superoxide dismutase family protein [Pseudomonadota bacterium]